MCHATSQPYLQLSSRRHHLIILIIHPVSRAGDGLSGVGNQMLSDALI